MTDSLDTLVADLRKRSHQCGSFSFRSGERVRDVAREAGVPNAHGVYVITGTADCVLYIGRSGTMRTNGVFRKQTLRSRLVNRQGRESRQEYFERMLSETGADLLTIEWFVTFGGACRVLPCLAESRLLQAYYDSRGRLPPYNKTA